MIERLRLHNFKCFADQEIRFAPLTLLVGANAAGKSSVVQALLLLRQSQRAVLLEQGQLLLRGDLTNVGTQAEVFRRGRQENDLTFELTENSVPQRFAFTFDGRPTAEYLVQGEKPTAPQGNLFSPEFNYLNAERVGPRLLYPIGSDERWPFDVGVQGEYIAAILGRFRDTNIANSVSDTPDDVQPQPAPALDPDAPIDPAAVNQPGTTTLEPAPRFQPLAVEVTHWMQELIPGFEFQAEIVPQTDQAIIRMRTSPDQEFVRPSNIGFGLIYTLPIIVAALVAPPGSLLIVENPEAHLHPRGQSTIGKFLARVAAAGVQVVVETHSDHVLNGIRVAVKTGAWGVRLEPDAVSIQYFMPADAEGPQRVRTPKMYPNGGIRPWPKGFFDQYESDLRKLL